jgi:signal peptidase I
LADAQRDDHSDDQTPAEKGQQGHVATTKHRLRSKHRGHPFWDFWAPVLFTIALYFGLRMFVGESRYIPSGSMLPGLKINDMLIIEKMAYRFRLPRRGEIVVFDAPYAFDPVLKADSLAPSLWRCLPANIPFVNRIPEVSPKSCDAYIKRVIGEPGDRVVVTPRGDVTINGDKLNEPYVTNYCPVDAQGMSRCAPLNVTVPEGHVLVLGDNRSNSWDGRYWPGTHFLPQSAIIGRAIWRFLPWDRAGALDS